MHGFPAALEHPPFWEAIGWAVVTLMLILSGGIAAWRGYRSSARGGLGDKLTESLAEAVARIEVEAAEHRRRLDALNAEHAETQDALHRIEEMTRATAVCVQRIEVDVARIHATVRPVTRE